MANEDPAELARAIRSAADAVARECGIPPGAVIVDDLGPPRPFRTGPYAKGETLDIPKPPPYDPYRSMNRHYAAQLLEQTRREAAILNRLWPTPPKPPTLAQRVREWRRRLGRWIAGDTE